MNKSNEALNEEFEVLQVMAEAAYDEGVRARTVILCDLARSARDVTRNMEISKESIQETAILERAALNLLTNGWV